MTAVELLSGTGGADRPLQLSFPAEWDVTVVGEQLPSACTEGEILSALQKPIGSRPLRDLAAGKRNAILLVDDISRPTPTGRILPAVLSELESAGLDRRAVTIMVAGGTHAPASPTDIRRKIGPPADSGLRVIPHDCRGDMVDLGRSAAGTPIIVNRQVVEADLRIGIGAIYPHPAAGFSGGAKIAVPGACGSETIVALHRSFRTSPVRGGTPECEFRLELEEIARRIGLDWVVNVALTARREIAAVFAGDPVAAHRHGVRRVRQLYSVKPVASPDIVMTDLFPFDETLQMAHDRGIWPLFHAGRKASRVLLASCPGGIGTHELFPVDEPVALKIRRRMKSLRLRDVGEAGVKFRRLSLMLRERKFNVDILSPHLSPGSVSPIFPRATIFAGWEDLLVTLRDRHAGKRVSVAVYRCAPLLIPE